MLEKLVEARRMLRPLKNKFYGLRKTETKEYQNTNIFEISIPYLCFGNIKLFCIDNKENGSFLEGVCKETIENSILKNFETQKTEKLTYEKWENETEALHYFDAKILDTNNNNTYNLIIRIKQEKKDNKL
jgi:hypothetical protein